jgi:hypothetical protein
MEFYMYLTNPDSAVGLATDYGLDLSPSRVKNFYFSTTSKPAVGAHLASYLMGTEGGSSPGGKAIGA